MTSLSVVLPLHIAAGFVALIAGYVALATAKGQRVHRLAGRVFVAAMAAMASTAIALGILVPDQLPNVFIGSLVLYLVGTGWSTVRRRERSSRALDVSGLLVALVLFAPFAVLSFQIATGATPFLRSAVALEGPVAIAIYAFTVVLGLSAFGDARVLGRGGLRGRGRVLRHIWRMCLGLTLATGSAFTNGFARFLPGEYHVPPAFHLPKVIPLGAMIYFLVRVRFGRSADRGNVGAG